MNDDYSHHHEWQGNMKHMNFEKRKLINELTSSKPIDDRIA